MDKIEYRAVIKFLVLEGNTAKQVEESSPSAATIKRWVKEFQQGRESLEDDPRPGRPSTSTNEENKGVIHVDYLPHGTTMNGEYYANLLKQVRQSIKDKRRGKICRGILLHQDNAPIRTSRVAMESVRECGYELLPHPPYSPDLAPSDFHLFPRLKKHIRGRRFQDDDELTAAVEGFLGDQDVEFFRSGINDWLTRWEKCVNVEGDYVEK